MASGDDNGIPGAVFGLQLHHDREMRLMEQLHGLKLQGAKGLGALNGAAAAASLAFIQAVAERRAFSVFKPFAVISLTCFLIGAMIAAIAFFSYYAQIRHKLGETARERTWGWISWGFLVTSAVAALTGSANIVWGIWCAL